ncbi:unnamed protein product [Pleuronectes platessa]|uniref:Uncharacterized protein n=1 Tax=Pleuronectes platessa TaxID=8262 RepID=A0A9N7Y8T8_PLEPL|nr:unnamed protein product [Pleuronectes platessa]
MKDSSVNFTRFSSDFWFKRFGIGSQAKHISLSHRRGELEGGGGGGGVGGEREGEGEGGGGGEEEGREGGGGAGGGKSRVSLSLSLSQARAYTEQRQAEKTMLYCFRPAGSVSLPETQQTTITHK